MTKERDHRPWTYFEIECPCETDEKINRLIGSMTFEEFVDKVEELMESA